MYLMIFEDGEIRKAGKYSNDELVSCDQGVLDLVDISNPSDPTTYYLGEWRKIDSVTETKNGDGNG